MPVTKMAVIYSIEQSRVRRIIVPDDDSDLDKYVNDILPGESIEMMPYAVNSLENIDLINQQISAITGRPTLDDKHVVLDADGNEVGSYLLDPTIDNIEVLGLSADQQLVAFKDVKAAKDAIAVAKIKAVKVANQ